MSLKFRLFPILLGTSLMLLSIAAIYLLALANQALAWPVIALLLSALVALVVTYIAQRRLFLALEAQRQALLRFASGDYGYRPDHRARDLVAFSTTMDALGGHLRHARENTRQQIERTTRELQESMETIEVKNVELDMARRRALQGNRSKSEFLANMSHEIRTPLNGIIGFCRLLSRSHLDSRQRDWLSHVETASNDLLTLINGILDVSKIEAGKLELETVTLDMVTLVDEVLVLLAPTSQQKGLQLLGLVYDDVPAELLGDPLRIKQVLTNLVHNAIKFTERGDVIVRVFVIDTQDDETTLRVKVSDTGIGLSPEVQKQLFQPFNQGSANRSRQYGGSGLGLTICKQLVEQMGGEIGVTSQAGQGATFSFTLPLLGPSPLDERAPELQLPEPGIALCERHKPTRQALSHLLDNWGAQVRIVDEKQIGNGLASPPDLLIVALDDDDLLPSALARWNLHLAGLTCPTVVLVNGNSYDLDDSMLPGASVILYKPITRAQLARTVRRQLQGDDEPVARKTATPPHAGHRPRVLVVDDVASNRLLIGELLARQGIASLLAESGEQALALVDDEAVDLIMMDIRMPGMSGVETLRRLRRLGGAWVHCPIVALTAHALEDEARALIDAGMQQVLTKPLDEKDLAGVLEDYLGLPSAEAIYRADDLPVVDTLLGRATAGGSASLANDVLALLLDDLDNSETAIRRARAGGDPDVLLDAVHHLNGACRYCGVPQLAILVDTLETRLRTRGSGDIDAMLTAIFDAMQRLRDWSGERDQSQQSLASS